MEYHLVLYLLTLLACGLLHFQAHGSLACLEEERVGLLKLKEAFHHPNASASLPSWRVEEIDCCRWERVTCDSMTKRVIGLSLSDARQLGFLNPSSFLNASFFLNASLFLPFQKLQNLSLDRSHLKGFYGELRLSKLQVLDLSWNMFTEIPSLGALQSLKILNLKENYLESFSHFEAELTTLNKLETLNLDGNNLIGEIPPSIGAMASLKVLSFKYNQLNGSLPMEGFYGELRLTKLQVLDLGFNNFTEIPSLGALQSLKILNLEFNFLESFSHFEGAFQFYSIALFCLFACDVTLMQNLTLSHYFEQPGDVES
ncbi:unnamed protein product [Ilex paraguariensis]|uniref:Leucine-rich repeat-containing N-terminal plant-type domain-containing protein n=1 Tax=Ilex paraguariensis TaxID=185542 RepID=A0ABC8R7H6_9AQUA